MVCRDRGVQDRVNCTPNAKAKARATTPIVQPLSLLSHPPAQMQAQLSSFGLHYLQRVEPLAGSWPSHMWQSFLWKGTAYDVSNADAGAYAMCKHHVGWPTRGVFQTENASASLRGWSFALNVLTRCAFCAKTRRCAPTGNLSS